MTYSYWIVVRYASYRVLYLRTECRVRIRKGQCLTFGPSEIAGRGRGLIVGHVVENLFILVPRRPSSPNTQQCFILLCEGGVPRKVLCVNQIVTQQAP